MSGTISLNWMLQELLCWCCKILVDFQISWKSCDLTLDTWDTDYIADNWEQQYQQLYCDLWIKSDRDSILNSWDVLLYIDQSIYCINLNQQPGRLGTCVCNFWTQWSYFELVKWKSATSTGEMIIKLGRGGGWRGLWDKNRLLEHSRVTKARQKPNLLKTSELWKCVELFEISICFRLSRWYF